MSVLLNKTQQMIKFKELSLPQIPKLASLRRSCRTLFNNKSIIGFSIRRHTAKLDIEFDVNLI
jgi:hypothetical protein